jgi:hypothetical protein
MGTFSEGIFFRSVKFIEQLECRAACPVTLGEVANQADITEMFTYMAELLGNSEIGFPEGWSHEDAERFLQDFRDLTFHPAFVKWFCKKMFRNPRLVQIDNTEEQYPESLGKIILANARDFRYTDGPTLNRDRMLLEERTNSFRRILPILRNETIKRFGFQRVLQLRKSEDEKNKLDILMKAMPSVEMSC